MMTARHDGADRHHMAHALRVGRRALGLTGDNPPVGCLIVKSGQVVGVGATAPGGRPHAETQALAIAGEAARGATAYVTLEPCCHHGRTPPCTDALIAAGIARAVLAVQDPDPRVDGKGIAALLQAGVAVETGLMAEAAAHDLAGFFMRVRTGRPFVTLKLAVSSDGMIAAASGTRTAITGASSLARVHLLRARSDSVLVGVSTVLADDPLLTCRLPGMEDRSPDRVVTDSRLTMPTAARLIRSAASTPVRIYTLAGHDRAKARPLAAMGAEIAVVAATPDNKVDLHALLATEAERGCSRVLAEGGAHMAAALIDADLVDEVMLFSAPQPIGPGGFPALADRPLTVITESGAFRLLEREDLGDDTLTAYERVR
jgi:diaminohydroxyphosphoribosylaminopyrimidine deaminase / 5-amino-6-(5-phosphoribosylamino)uracil reductase